MKPVDVLIHIRQKLDDGSRHLIDGSLRKVPGVIAPWFAPHKKTVSLMVVYYDPEVITATSLLSCVRRLGFSASLIAI